MKIKKWFTDLAFWVDLAAHLNSLNVYLLQGEYGFICAMFQTTAVFKMILITYSKFWLWQIILFIG